jgi:hypothetical protein
LIIKGLRRPRAAQVVDSHGFTTICNLIHFFLVLLSQLGYCVYMILRNTHDPRYTIKKNRPVYVYKNLHKNCWSIKQHGLVKAHIPQGESVGLWDCYFHVDAKGREKVVREKRKNVHAFVKGYLQDAENVNTDRPATEVTYNPYKYETFVDKNTEKFVYYADEVLLTHNQVTAYIP